MDAIGTSEAVRRIVALARGEHPGIVVTLGTEMVVRAQGDERFRAIVNSAALSLCDTIGVLLAARMQGVRIAERTTGVDLIDPLSEALAWEGLPVYLLGGRGDTAARAGVELARRHPGLAIAGARDGFFSEDESGAVAAAIARSGARVVLAGLGSPRQEYWLAEHLAATGARAGIGVGGSFDVIAGDVLRAPAVWRRLHVEWFYRLLSEPSRWRRQLALPYFVLLMLRDRLRG